MNLIDIISPVRTFIDVEGSSKKRVLELSAELIARECPGFNAGELFDSMINREKLGSTGLGHGVAIPHCRLSACPQPMGTLLRLREPVDYDAIDNEPVDLLFILLVPTQATDEHLQLLSQIAERFSSAPLRAQMRQAPTAETLFQAFLGNI
jgi:PTS system nitrogen regulatory IIA component